MSEFKSWITSEWEERMSKRDEEEARRELWATRVGWSVIVLGVIGLIFLLSSIWTGDDRLGSTAAVFLVPAGLMGAAWGFYKMENSF